jgi:hypothetical protein
MLSIKELIIFSDTSHVQTGYVIRNIFQKREAYCWLPSKLYFGIHNPTGLNSRNGCYDVPAISLLVLLYDRNIKNNNKSNNEASK